MGNVRSDYGLLEAVHDLAGRSAGLWLLFAMGCGGDSQAIAVDESGSTTTSSADSSVGPTETSSVGDLSTDGMTGLGSTSSSDGTGSGTTVVDESSSSGESGAAFPECPSFAIGVNLGLVADGAIVETSGLAASRAHDGVLWLHNDSGDSARAFAINSDGVLLGELPIGGALALDWEDMSLGPGPAAGVDYLYFGDIGDNFMFRPFVTAYRVPEPDPALLDGPEVATAINLHFPDGPHDAETLMSDPTTGDLYIVSKVASGQSGVYRAAFPQTVGMTNELELVASLSFGVDPLPGSPLVTGGDFAPDGSLVVLRTYSSVFAWRRTAALTVGEAFATEPCELPVSDEPGGEAVAVGSTGYYTVSEGAMVPVWHFEATDGG